jgi:iron(III) transport system permease protein
MKRATLWLLWLFFAAFLFYPIGYVVKGALIAHDAQGHARFTLEYFALLFQNQLYSQAFLNSLLLASTTTVCALALTLPLAVLFARCKFPGKTVLNTLMLVPLILPPFVGAIGIKQFFARFGTLNLLLSQAGIVSLEHPPDWFGSGGFTGIVVMEVLALFPILFLSVSAALANVDPSLRDAASNLGASPGHTFRTVTLPLTMPGIFAGSCIVFVAAFTDLGTPLIFDYRTVVPVQIFTASSEAGDNPLAYTLVLMTLLVVGTLFLLARKLGDTGSHAMMSRAASYDSTATLRGWKGALATLAVLGLLMLALLPHLGVLLNSVSERWFFSVLPSETSARFFGEVMHNETTSLAIRNSLVYSSLSALLDLVLGVLIAQKLARDTFRGKALLDAVAMIPLALPGLVLAFGYVASFNFDISWLNPRQNPTLLLIISYAVRRLPYIVRAAYAGYQQTSVTLEEASLNLGASRFTTLRRITLPLIAANLVAGTILTFAFAMLEVSDSLILAMESRFAPITKAIYDLMGRPNPEAIPLACALGVLAMCLLGASLFVASRLLGQKMGQLFRA